MVRSATTSEASEAVPDSEAGSTASVHQPGRAASSIQGRAQTSQAQSSSAAAAVKQELASSPAEAAGKEGSATEGEDEEEEENADTSGTDETHEQRSEDDNEQAASDNEVANARGRSGADREGDDAPDEQAVLNNEGLKVPSWMWSLILRHNPNLARPSERPTLNFIDRKLGPTLTQDVAADYYTDTNMLYIVVDGLGHAFKALPTTKPRDPDCGESDEVLCSVMVRRRRENGSDYMSLIERDKSARGNKTGRASASEVNKPQSDSAPGPSKGKPVSAADGTGSRADDERRVKFQNTDGYVSSSTSSKFKPRSKTGSKNITPTAAQGRASTSFKKLDESGSDDPHAADPSDADDEDEEESPTQNKRKKVEDSDEEEATSPKKAPRGPTKAAAPANKSTKPHTTPTPVATGSKAKASKTPPAPLKSRAVPNAKIVPSPARERSTSTASSGSGHGRQDEPPGDGRRHSSRESKKIRDIKFGRTGKYQYDGWEHEPPK